MGKIDWYILKKFIVTFFFCMVMFMVVAVAVDSSEKTDDFVKTGLSTGQIIRQYYFGFVPFIWGLLFPLFVFIACIFFTSKMATRSEIIAILASGTSYRRLLRPYLVGGLFLGTILWFGTRYLIPRANGLRSAFQANYIDKNDPAKNQQQGSCYNCFYQRVDSNTYVGMKNYDTVSKSANKFFMEVVKDNKIVYNLRANTIKWDSDRRRWKLLDAVERKVDSMGERTKTFKELGLRMRLKPDELRKDEYLKDRLTTPELVAYIREEQLRGREGLSALQVERYRRTATPYAVVMLALLGVIIASRKTRGGSGLHLAIGIIVAVLFIVSDRFSTVFATKSNFPPLLAAWLPNIVFTLVAWYMYRRTPK
ncbi:MAG: YjgP/YjgQ family permease [Chitinophagaceae bacterium]|nr:MAG: YjgP/YjgQ family permease [Chitinophagaceae bacterium]